MSHATNNCRYILIKKSLEKCFNFENDPPTSLNDINLACQHLVSLYDNDRIKQVGYILHYLIDNIHEDLPQNFDLFMLSLYPDIYPKIEDWQDLAIKTGNDPIGKEIQISQQNFLQKLSIKQSKIIYISLKTLVNSHMNFYLGDFEAALLMYWNSRAKGEKDFFI